MKAYIKLWMGIILIGTFSCTSLSEGGNAAMEPHPDHNRRVRLQPTEGNTMYRMQLRMAGQASEINRKRNIEDSGTGVNSPGTTPPLLRPERTPNAPVDSTRHIMPLPQNLRPPR